MKNMVAKIKVKYRKNSHEKYFEYIVQDMDCFAFSLVAETLKKTNCNRLEIVVEKLYRDND